MLEYGHVAHQINRLNATITNMVSFFLYVDWFSRYSIRRDMLTHHEIGFFRRLSAFFSAKSL